jgi:hypothetical protein
VRKSDKAALAQSVEGYIDNPVVLSRRYRVRDGAGHSRDERVLDLAAQLLADGQEDVEVIRREFGSRFGRIPVEDEFRSEVTVAPLPGRGVRVVLDLVSITDWRRLQDSELLASIPADWNARAESAFRDATRQRRRFREGRTVIRSLAVHYLSGAGGGALSEKAAADAYSADARCAAHDPRASWDASEHAKVIAQVQAELGTLP